MKENSLKISDELIENFLKLEKIDKQMATQRSNRGQLVRVALVGYTNVGKSTLMNMIAGFLSLAAKQVKPDIGGALNEIRAMEFSTVEINGYNINVVVLTVILLVLVFLGGVLSK